MDSGLYFHGYDYSTGVLQLGAPCVAPILEVRNALCEPLTVSWASRAAVPEHSLVAPDQVLEQALSNQVSVCPGETALLTCMFSSAAPYFSVLQLQSASTGLDVYVLNFTAERGYFFSRVLKPCSAPPEGEEGPFTKELLQGATFTLGATAPPPRSIWSNAIVFPVKVVRIPLSPSLPCLAAAGS
jgi:hypothetical protein